MTFAQGIVEVVAQLAPSLVVLIFIGITMAWIRLLVDKMSPRGF